MANGQRGAARGAVIQGSFIGGRFSLPGVTSQPSHVRPRATGAQSVQPRMAQPNAAQSRGANPNINHHSAHLQRIAQAKMAGPRAVPQQAVQPRLAAPHGPVVQRHANGEAFQLPANLSNFGGGGQPLPGAVRQKMESFFGTSFADVRVHVGPQASAIGALAFTQGSNLYFAQGQYNPHTPQGQQILGHELTHVVQQRAGRVNNPFGSGVAVVQDHGMEAEADRMGRLAAAHSAPVQPCMPGREVTRGHGARSNPARQAFGAVQRLTVTQTQAEFNQFDLNGQLVEVQHTRAANTPSTTIPQVQIDNQARNKTVNHCLPYNYIRDQLITICKLSANRQDALGKLINIANSLGVPAPGGTINSRQHYDAVIDKLIGNIANYGGNMFVCDGSSRDRGGADRDVPPQTFAGAASLEFHVSRLQVAMDSQMPKQQVVRQHFNTHMSRSGEKGAPIVVEL
jgi:hypothetical protein